MLESNTAQPDDATATQFAIMLQAGLPASEAILYFMAIDEPKELLAEVKRWQRSPKVRNALLKLMKTPWQKMNTDERMRHALDLHYSQLAYVLYSQNYLEAGTGEKAKADTARTAIEAKLAGTAGKLSAMDQFYDDLNSGRLKLGPQVKNKTQVDEVLADMSKLSTKEAN